MGYGPTELFLANFSGIQEELGKLFGQHGIVRDFWVSQKKGPRNSAGALFGVVRMATHQEALVAKKELHGTAFNGKTLSVKWASNQRVLWVGQLGPTVTNEVLETAFAQFGALERSIVVANPETGISRRYGFVAFEKKEDATRALSMCNSNFLIIGTFAEPIEVELAWLDDSDEGFTEEMSSASKRGHNVGLAPPIGVPSHFAQASTAEYSIAMQLKELRSQYKMARERLKAEMSEGTHHLVAKGMPLGPLPSRGQTLFAQTPVPLDNPLAQVPRPVPWAGGEKPRGPYDREDERGWHHRQHDESFHDVPPPRKIKRGSYDEFRFNPRPVDVPPPDLVAAASLEGPSAQGATRRSAFVRGGELHTEGVEHSEAQQPLPSEPAQHYRSGHDNQQPPLPEEKEEDSRMPGMKPPGKHGHQGIGFSGLSSNTPASNEVYQLGMPHQLPDYNQSYHQQQGLPPSVPPLQQHFQPQQHSEPHFQRGQQQQPFFGGGPPRPNIPDMFNLQSSIGFGGPAMPAQQPFYPHGLPAHNGSRSGGGRGRGRGYGRGRY